jgi:competence protein ComEC
MRNAKSSYHIFAVDGLRVAIIAGILFGLMRTLRVPRAWCALLSAPILLFYAAITGWPASAIRAIVMALVVFGGWTLKRPSDLINSLFAAALIILVWEPRQLFQAGFQLSFFVVLCIILILPFFQRLNEHILTPDPLLPESLQPRWKRLLRTPVLWITDLFLTSLAAWLGSIPLVAYYFHILTPCSGPANVLAVPLCALVLICNLASLLFGAWFPAVAILFNHSGWFWMECIRHTSQWSAHWPAAYFYVPTPSMFTIGLYYFALVSIFTGWLFKNPYRIYKVGTLVLLCGIWCGLWLHERPATCLTILPVGNGYCAYLRCNHSAEDWLIDCGNESSAEMVTVPFLRAQGVNHLSHLVLTHGNAGYVGGAQSILTNFHPAQVVLNPIESRSQEYRAVERFVQSHLPPQQPVKPGEKLGPWTILHPDPVNSTSRADDNAIVLLGDIDGTRVLLLSGLGREGQLALLSRTNDLHADILVTAADPLATSDSLSQTLLDTIHPRVIVIHDTLRHPAGEELQSPLRRRHIPILYTSQTRAVTLTTRPGHWQLTTTGGTHFP